MTSFLLYLETLTTAHVSQCIFKPSGYALFIFWHLIYLWPFTWSDFHACMRVVLTIGLTGLALLQSGSCGANVQNKYLGQLLPGPGRSSITILPASRQAASPSSFVSCILYPYRGKKKDVKAIKSHKQICRNRDFPNKGFLAPPTPPPKVCENKILVFS